jgi:hypothetical protein
MKYLVSNVVLLFLNSSYGPFSYPVVSLILFWITVIYFRIFVKSFHVTAFLFHKLIDTVSNFLALPF